jgi:hypothetical protein
MEMDGEPLPAAAATAAAAASAVDAAAGGEAEPAVAAATEPDDADDARSGWYGLCEILLRKGPKYAGKVLREHVERSVRMGERQCRASTRSCAMQSIEWMDCALTPLHACFLFAFPCRCSAV